MMSHLLKAKHPTDTNRMALFDEESWMLPRSDTIGSRADPEALLLLVDQDKSFKTNRVELFTPAPGGGLPRLVFQREKAQPESTAAKLALSKKVSKAARSSQR